MRRDAGADEPPLDHHIRGLLTSLVRIEAPWMREFPTVARWDDQAGKALARQQNFQPAREIAATAGQQRMIGARDAVELALLGEAAHPTDFQGQKAGNRVVGHVRNLLIYSGGLLATLLAGAVASDLAPGSVLARHIATTFNEAEAQIEALAETMPGDLAQALRGLAKAGGELDGLAPVRGPAPRVDPEVPGDVEEQAQEMILRGHAPPPEWRPFIRLLSFAGADLNSLHLLAGLTALQTLDLARTAVNDVAPLKALTALQNLNLWRTQVTDVAPLAGLIALQDLNLWNTQVSDVAPLAGLTAVQSLDLRNTRVSDVAPLAGLTALQSLDLGRTQVSDVAPLAGLTALQSLDLWGTQVSDVAPLAGLTTLQRLSLMRTQVSDVGPLAALTALRNLDLRNTQVSDVAPLAGLTALQTLYLEGTQVSDVAPLAGLTALQRLFLSSTQVGDVAPLAGLTALQILDLQLTQVRDVAPLAHLRDLKIFGGEDAPKSATPRGLRALRPPKR